VGNPEETIAKLQLLLEEKEAEVQRLSAPQSAIEGSEPVGRGAKAGRAKGSTAKGMAKGTGRGRGKGRGKGRGRSQAA
jgi:hypothetical protein